MFCPNCGETVNGKLKYCNRCGTMLSKPVDVDKDGTPGKMLDNVLTTLFLTIMFGLGILVGLVAVLLKNSVPTEVLTIIVLAYLTVIFGVCFTLVRQVPKLIDARLKGVVPSHEQQMPGQFAPPITAQLGEHRDAPGSVTDQTTRTLEHAYIDKR